MNIRQEIERFLEYIQLEKRYSPNTVIAYQNDLDAFADFLDQRYQLSSLSDIDLQIVRSWLADLKNTFQLDPRSIRRKVSSLNSFYKYLLRLGIVDKTPVSGVILPKVKKRLPQFLSEKDTSHFDDPSIYDDAWKGRNEKMILVLLYNTGMRISELIHLTQRQLDWGNQQVKILGKGNKERLVPLSDELVNEIKDYLACRPIALEAEPILLVNDKGLPLNARYAYQLCHDILSRITTIEKKSPHVLRHTFATQLMNHGADLNAVKELLGHSSLAATQVYTHNSIEQLKSIFKQAHPKA